MSSDYISAEQYGDGDIDIYLPKNGKYEYVGNCEMVSLSYVDPLEGETLIEDAMPTSGEF